MKFHRSLPILAASFVLVFSFGSLAFANHHDEADEHDAKEVIVAWVDVPAVVQKAILAYAEGGKVEQVEMETDDGEATYEAEVELANGDDLKIEVNASGKLMEFKRKAEHEDEDRD